MWRAAIDQRSPMQNIENSIHSGLGVGHVGVITARPGSGKSACLMQIGINELIHERPVLHVAINQTAGRVRDAYDELLHAIADTCGIKAEFDALRVAVERYRHLHGYAAERFDLAHLIEAVEFLGRYADFRPQVILIDGLDTVAHDPACIDELCELARKRALSVWLTASTDGAGGDQVLPTRLSDKASLLGQVLHLAPAGEQIALRVVKNGGAAIEDLRLQLDPSTMLLHD